MIKQFFVTIISFSFLTAYPQTAGKNIYNFLDLPNSARAASLGGQQISIFDDDLNFVYQNPSLLNSSMSNQLTLNYIPYVAKINYGYMSYAHTLKNSGNIAAGIHYINYGQFIEADEYGNKGGHFTANEFSLNLIYARPILDSLFNVGVTYKIIYSQMEVYNSLGMAIDAGITYNSKDKLFSTALVLKNFGVELFTYTGNGKRETLPFEIQYGLSQKLRYAPFRISLLLQHLETPDLRYTSMLDSINQTDALTGQQKSQSNLDIFADNVMRHIIIGLEFLPSKFFAVRLGYNYQRRQELKIVDKTALVGFTWGIGINAAKFHISYGHASYHLSAASNNITLSLNLSEFKKKF
jgi:hypothetical protein